MPYTAVMRTYFWHTPVYRVCKYAIYEYYHHQIYNFGKMVVSPLFFTHWVLGQAVQIQSMREMASSRLGRSTIVC